MSYLKLIIINTFIGAVLLVGLSYALDMGIYNATMQAGEDYRLEMTMNVCADSPPPADLTKCVTLQPADLTGYSYKAQFRSAPYPAGVLYATYSTVFVNMTGGRVDVRLSAAQTATNSGKSGVWDLRETNPSGITTYKAGGKAVCQPTVTR